MEWGRAKVEMESKQGGPKGDLVQEVQLIYISVQNSNIGVISAVTFWPQV